MMTTANEAIKLLRGLIPIPLDPQEYESLMSGLLNHIFAPSFRSLLTRTDQLWFRREGSDTV